MTRFIREGSERTKRQDILDSSAVGVEPAAEAEPTDTASLNLPAPHPRLESVQAHSGEQSLLKFYRMGQTYRWLVVLITRRLRIGLRRVLRLLIVA